MLFSCSLHGLYSVAILAHFVMAQFAKLPCLGHVKVDLDEVPSDDCEFEAGYFWSDDEKPDVEMELSDQLSEAETIPEIDLSSQLSEAQTIPGSPAALRVATEIIEVEDSDSEVETKTATMLSIREEQLRMNEEEKYGHFHRLEVKQEHIEARLKKIDEAKRMETPEQRRLRRRRIQEHIMGDRIAFD